MKPADALLAWLLLAISLVAVARVTRWPPAPVEWAASASFASAVASGLPPSGGAVADGGPWLRSVCLAASVSDWGAYGAVPDAQASCPSIP